MNTHIGNTPVLPVLVLTSLLVPAIGLAADIQWTNVVNASANGNSLVKTSGCDGCEDAGARSTQELAQGNVYVEYHVPDVDKITYVGISNESTGTEDEDMDFAIRTQEGMAEVRENGAYRADVRVEDGDIFRISIENGVVSYFHNGMAFYTSENSPEYPLLVDVSLVSAGAAVENVVAHTF